MLAGQLRYSVIMKLSMWDEICILCMLYSAELIVLHDRYSAMASPFSSSYLPSSHTVSLCHLILHGRCQCLSSTTLSFCCKSCTKTLQPGRIGGVQHLLWQQVCLAMAEYLSCNTSSSALYNIHRMQISSHNDSFMMTLYLSCPASIYHVSYLGE